MNRRALAAAAVVLVIVLLLGRRAADAPAPVTVPVLAPPPIGEELCAGSPSEPAPPERAVAPDADPFTDTGGPLVTLDVRGTLRVECVREDGTPEPRATVQLLGCGRPWAIERGATSRWRLDPDPCLVMAWRQDGLASTRRQTVRVGVEPGQESVLRLVFPDAPVGSPGLVLEGTDLGVEIIDVLPGSPAEAAGVEPGDVLRAIDGVDVTAFSAYELEEALTGPDGAPVTLTIGYAGDTGLLEADVDAGYAFRED